MIKVAITGTIAAGKTTLANIFREKGILVFDSDLYAKSLYRKGTEVYQALLECFSVEILDDEQEIDLTKLKEAVFLDENKRKQINEIVHPAVKKGLKEFIDQNQSEEIVCAEVPLLFQAGFEYLFDFIVVVTCEDKIAIDRMMEYRHYSYEEALLRLESQKLSEKQLSFADEVLYNNTNRYDFEIQANRLLERLQKA